MWSPCFVFLGVVVPFVFLGVVVLFFFKEQQKKRVLVSGWGGVELERTAGGSIDVESSLLMCSLEL